MNKVAGVEFKENGKVYYFKLNDIEVEKGWHVVVNTEKGEEYGRVVSILDKKDIDQSLELLSVERIATDRDEKKYNKNQSDARKAIEKAVELADNLGLTMKFVDASYTFERNQLIFYFISDGRVDFRELAKSLAGIYKTRIELRQIGVRDKAKEVSGIGPCGRQLCCSCFLNDLDSVTISMAKNQNLVLNPTKINGLCGRLLCCLNYEDELYKENRIDMPELGSYVETENGKGNVIFIDIPNRKYIVNVENYGKVTVKLKSKCDECGKCSK